MADGTRRWGRFGAAGVLVRCAGADGRWWYFLARRSERCHQGGCWAVPGGALNQGEEPLEAALREFVEEVGAVLQERHFSLIDVHEDEHGGWSYWTVVIEVPERFALPTTVNWETAETGWIAQDELRDLELHPAFRRTLGRLGYLHDSRP